MFAHFFFPSEQYSVTN